MRTTIDIPELFLQRAKAQAAERGVTLSVLVQDALRSYLAQSANSSGSEFPLQTVRGRLVHPELDLDRTSALITMDDESEYSSGKV